jgi:hypothetical protein
MCQGSGRGSTLKSIVLFGGSAGSVQWMREPLMVQRIPLTSSAGAFLPSASPPTTCHSPCNSLRPSSSFGACAALPGAGASAFGPSAGFSPAGVR